MRKVVQFCCQIFLKFSSFSSFVCYLFLVSCFDISSTPAPRPVFVNTSKESRIIEVFSRAELEKTIASFNRGKLLVLLSLYTCPYCRALKNSLEQYLATSSEFQVINLDISHVSKSSYADKGLKGVPFLEFYCNGSLKKTHEGSLTISQILALFNQVVSNSI